MAVPHRLQETKVLHNLGFKPPAPIRHYYDWSGEYTPFQAQLEAAAFLSLYKRAFNLSELGTGKSLASLWAYDYCKKIGVYNKALVVAPLSTLERTWADEVFRHFPHLDYAVLHGTRQKRLKLLNEDADIYIINHDGVGIIKEELAQRPDINLIMVDEVAQVARNASTDRWKHLNAIVNKQHPRGCWGMTGTPTPNAPTDAWAQCRLIKPENVPPYFNRFRNKTMNQINQFTWVPKKEANDVVSEAMQPSVRFTRDECVDLPPLTYETRVVQISKEQQKAYKDMMNRLCVQADEGEITAVNEAVKMSKLVQIACGVAYNNDGDEVTLDATARINEVERIVNSAEGKVIVFVPYVSSVTRVSQELEAKGISTAIIHGGVKKRDRDTIFTEFTKCPDPKVLVAQPAAMSHGLTLTAASTIVWYSCVTSNETFEQANGRINRPGQKMNNFIIMLEGTPVEERIYDRLKNKQKMQGALLDEIKLMRGEVIT